MVFEVAPSMASLEAARRKQKESIKEAKRKGKGSKK
jgi:hypothetical protein